MWRHVAPHGALTWQHMGMKKFAEKMTRARRLLLHFVLRPSCSLPLRRFASKPPFFSGHLLSQGFNFFSDDFLYPEVLNGKQSILLMFLTLDPSFQFNFMESVKHIVPSDSSSLDTKNKLYKKTNRMKGENVRKPKSGTERPTKVNQTTLTRTTRKRKSCESLDRKEYFEITWASLRAMVEPPFAERSVIYHRDYLTNGLILTSSAINITDSEVITAAGQLVPYDYLVIATGHADPLPHARNDRLKQFEQDNEKIKEARSILIIGGGPTGVELAGEIAVDYPEKEITLVHRGSRLLEFIGPKASQKALNWLQGKGVQVKLGQSIDMSSGSKGNNNYVTSTGETVKADCFFLCFGKPLGSKWLKETILKNSLDSSGRLKVDQNLRVIGKKNIFAVGDITDIKELKQGYLAQKHALVATKNLKLMLNGGNESKMEKYKPGSALAIVSLGRKEAVAQFPLTTLIGVVPGCIKSKDLFVGKTRKQMGLALA